MSLCPLHISSIVLFLLIIASCAETDDKTVKTQGTTDDKTVKTQGTTDDKTVRTQGTTDNNMLQVTEIHPEPGTWIGPEVQFTVRFSAPIVPNSGSITFGNWSFKLPYTEPSDTITWNRCFAGFIPLGEQVTLTVNGFEDVDGRIQAEPFQASFPVFVVDIAPPEIVTYQPMGDKVNPAITRAIRVTLNRPVQQINFEIFPHINGIVQIANDLIQCTSIAVYHFMADEQLQADTEYHIVLELMDIVGNQITKEFRFATQ